MEIGSPSRIFTGVRFVLFGLNPSDESEVRAMLVNGGGVDVGQYGGSCSHVIVDNLVYDNPVCNAAREDGKILVTRLWVYNSFDTGVAMDAASIMYRPLRDLNGIPGARNLVVCLTGYHRRDRDDVMTMVGLMGAQFSKPLVANKITHLICFKFEGEKYELAKRIQRIKLVNHQWLEDCLREWDLLPEANYSLSGYELEMMKCEAKDSEGEADKDVEKEFGGKDTKSPLTQKLCFPSTNELPKPEVEVSNASLVSFASKDLLDVCNAKSPLLGPRYETRVVQPTDPAHINVYMDATCSKLPEKYIRAENSMKSGNELTSTCQTPTSVPVSNKELCSRSYSRRRLEKSTLPLHLGERLDNPTNSSKLPSGERKDSHSFDTLLEMEQVKDKPEFGSVETPQKGIDLLQKRTLDTSYGSSKSRKMNHDQEAWLMRTSVSEMTHISPRNGEPRGNNADMSPPKNLRYSTSPTISTGAADLPLKKDQSFTKSVTPETEKDASISKKTPQKSFQKLKESTFSSTPEMLHFGTGISENTVGRSEGTQNYQDCIKAVSETHKSAEAKKVNDPTNSNLLTTHRKKTIGKKSLGSRHKLNSGANQKGSIHFSKATQNNDAKLVGGEDQELVISPQTANIVVSKPAETKNVEMSAFDEQEKRECVDEDTEAPEDADLAFEKFLSEERSEVVPSTNEAHRICKEKSALKHGSGSFKDAAALEETVRNEPEELVGSRSVEASELNLEEDDMEGKTNFGRKRSIGKAKKKAALTIAKPNQGPESPDQKTTQNEVIEEKGKDRSQPLSGRPETKSICLDVDNPEQTAKDIELEGLVCSLSVEIDEPKPNGGEVEGEMNIGKTGYMAERKKGAANSATESNQCFDGKATHSEHIEKAENENKSCSLKAGPKSKRQVSVGAEKSEKATELEKENKPLRDGDSLENESGKPPVESKAKAKKINQKAAKRSHCSSSVRDILREVKTKQNNQSWFILSGHRLQRKEFQKVIRNLKGKLCRDSHQWSYQATHFITPDPIRRTEKFFAAAASGRWVLKTDYLTASSQAGQFLPEEPYEWYKKGLNEDGAINLEAPRKWRLLRERTGHGAFYGMHIIIYGECIAPPLDTLKRVIKAGDGTILATCPPYSRFLKSQVDYAIISPGLTHADIWIQEFLNHKIPCVAADYIVEYVCKPGYPLGKHVLYNTHSWVERSFRNLHERSEEVVDKPMMSSLPDVDCVGSDDIACGVCGSHDRAEVMLICGNENGTIGCGIGMHIDCCDPPLIDVPGDDWFCSKCSLSRDEKSGNKRKKGVSSSKR